MKKYGLFTLVALSTIIMYAMSSANAEPNELMIYDVNKNVADFGDNDFSTPEAAYAAINRIVAINDAQKLAAVSLTRLSDGVIKAQISDNPLSPEWKKTLENAQILEVWVWKDKYAAVIAELPQKFSDKPIEKPIDIRGLNPENGKWLNHEDGRVWTVEEARAFLSEDVGNASEREKKLRNRTSSAKRLSELGKALIVFANDNNEKYPESLQDLSMVDVNAEDLAWLTENIEYIGNKVKLTDLPNAVIAYDKALFEGENSEGTNVLYNDLHVSFEKNNSLEKLGINTRSTGFDKLTTGSSGQAEIKNDFKATLSNGVTVELIGVCEHPSKGKQWWRPDGNVLVRAVPEHNGINTPPLDGNRSIEVLLSYSGAVVRDIGFKWKLSNGLGDGTWPIDVEKENLRGIVFQVPNEVNKTDISIGLAAGKWNNSAYLGISGGATNSNEGDISVIYHPLYEKYGKTFIDVSYGSLKVDIRVVAVDESGKLHANIDKIGGEGNDFLSYRFAFDLPAKEIKSFILQTRAYEWFTFKDVSLRSGVKTDVQIGTVEDSRKLLMERRDILQKTLHDAEMRYNAGRADSKQLGQVKIDLLRVEIELSETPQKRVELLSQIVTIYAEQEKSTKLLLDAGRTTLEELNKAKLLRLNAEEELAKATAETKKI
ncbi:MAG: hypothetical protein ACYC3B_04390 [Sedimentisphaerales bacterium]